jgi:hypothetical protein
MPLDFPATTAHLSASLIIYLLLPLVLVLGPFEEVLLEFESDVDVADEVSVSVSELNTDPCVATVLELYASLVAPCVLSPPVLLLAAVTATGFAK